jgi:hypothetical protein
MRSRQGAAAGTIKPTALPAMTPEAEATAPEAETRAPRQGPDLFGVAFLATIGIVMIAWVGGLIWAATAVVEWLMS